MSKKHFRYHFTVHGPIEEDIFWKYANPLIKACPNMWTWRDVMRDPIQRLCGLIQISLELSLGEQEWDWS
jgi:hypothetical protein